MTVSRMVVLMCDANPDLCDEESSVGMDLNEARALARSDGWHVGRTLDHRDYCPKHAGAPTEIPACAGRMAVAHQRTPMVNGVCPVCGEIQ